MTDTSILTAVANDYAYERVFQRQVEALCAKGDVLVGISTSGSKNACAALLLSPLPGGAAERWRESHMLRYAFHKRTPLVFKKLIFFVGT